jgi:hypothetical protein
MSFLSGAAHLVGDVAAPVAKAAGAVGSLGGLLPNSGSTRLTNIGSAIASPNQVLSNASGIFNPNAASFSAAAAQAPVKAQNNTPVAQAPQLASPTQNQTGAGTGAGTSSNTGAINSAYDTLSNYYKGLAGTVQPQQDVSSNDITNQFNDQYKSLSDQRDSAFANLDNQQNVVNQSYSKSLHQLGNSIRNTAQGQQNALGVGGAGDSSAADMLGYALSNMQNTNRGYMNQDMNNQLNSIGLNRTADTNQFNDQAQTLSDWKGQQLHGIQSQYAQLLSSINEKLAGNEQYRQLALNQAGAWASGQAQQVDNTLNQSLGNLNSTYQNAKAPTASINLPQYQAQAINAPTVAIGGQMTQPTTPQDVMQYVSPQSYKDQSQTNQFSF